MEFIRVIQQLLKGEQNIQIVATTHSPYILDELDPSDVHVFALGDDDAVVVKRLSDHPEAEKMKGALSASQLWSLDPEFSAESAANSDGSGSGTPARLPTAPS